MEHTMPPGYVPVNALRGALNDLTLIVMAMQEVSRLAPKFSSPDIVIIIMAALREMAATGTRSMLDCIPDPESSQPHEAGQ